MTKETIIKEDGRLLVYYRFGQTAGDAETRGHGDAATTQSQHGDVSPIGTDPSGPSTPSA